MVHTDDEDVKQDMDAADAAGDVDVDDAGDDDDEDWQSEDYGSETLKQLTTPVDDTNLDEFAIFKQTILGVQQHDPEWWNILTVQSSETDKVGVQGIIFLKFYRKTVSIFVCSKVAERYWQFWIKKCGFSLFNTTGCVV